MDITNLFMCTAAGGAPPEPTPNSRWLAVLTSATPYMHVLDADDGYSAVTVGGGAINLRDSLAFSPDGTMFAKGGSGRVVVYAVPAWTILYDSSGDSAVVGSCLRFSPDSSKLVCGGSSKIEILQTSDFTKLSKPAYFSDAGASQLVIAHFTHGGTKLFLKSYGVNNAYVYNVSDWTLSATISTGFSDATNSAMRPDGAEIAIGAVNTYKLTTIATSDWAVTNKSIYRGISYMDYSRDSTRLAADYYTNPNQVHVFDTSDYSILQNYSTAGTIRGVSYNQEQTYIANGVGSKVEIWETTGFTRTYNLTVASVWTLAYSPT